MNKLRITIENYRMLWKEPDFRWLQQFNWLITSRKIARSLVLWIGLLAITSICSISYFYIENQLLVALNKGTDFTPSEINRYISILPNLVLTLIFFYILGGCCKMMWNWHEYEAEKSFKNRYKKMGLYFDEKINDVYSKSEKIKKTFRNVVMFFIFSITIQMGDQSKMASIEFFRGLIIAIYILFVLWIITKLLIYLKFKKWAKDFKEHIHILTTERDFIRLTNQMDSLLILPEKWKGYLKEDLVFFTQSVKRTDLEIEGEPVNDVVSRLEVVYLVPFTSIRIVYSIQLVEFETEVELNEYKKDLEEAYEQAPGKGPRVPEIKVLLANLETDNLNRINADSLSKKNKK